MNELFELFTVFARIGGLTFGGGYAMLPMLQLEIVEKRAWATEQDLMDYYAIGQCTPGIIAVNTATFVGYSRKGIKGGICATLGVCFPSFIIIIIIAALVQNFSDLIYIQQAFAGIRVCVVVLIFNAVVRLWKSSVIDKTSLCIFVCVFILSAFTSVSSMIFIIAAGIIGFAVKRIKPEMDGDKK